MSITTHNPFFLRGYHGAYLFCDREDETELLIQNATNGVNTLLFSPRKMGKTGLISHTFNQLKNDKNWNCIYIDIFATQSITDFTNELATAILVKFPPTKSVGKKFLDLLKGFSPVISYDPLSGLPEVSFTFNQPQQYQQSLKSLFAFLDQQDKMILLAIDEFQQITTYPETNTEAILRTIIQKLNNIVFIYSGSRKHLLINIFNDAKRPFYQSSQPLFLDFIPTKKYQKHIKKLFAKYGKTIDTESVEFILNWTHKHTYYTQSLCNKVFTQSQNEVTLPDVLYACDTILQEQKGIYFQYRSLLTKPQWALLTAIGKEEQIEQPTANQFIRKHELSGPASVKRSLTSLIQKEMVYEDFIDNKKVYWVYDRFLSKWLGR